MISALSVHYLTQNIPAPYAFTIEADIKRSSGLDVAFKLTYTDREELDEDEITSEGFSGNDDFSWSGQLPQAWQHSLEELLNKTTWSKKVNKLSRCKIRVTSPEGGVQYPANIENWEYWLQELQQACIEAAKIEKPLEMDWVRGERKLSLKGSFERREASIENRSTSLVVSKSIPWYKLGKVLKHIYIAEYYPEEALATYDTKGDAFLNIGGGQWFNLSKTNLHLDKKQDWIDKLEAAFNDLLTGPSA